MVAREYADSEGVQGLERGCGGSDVGEGGMRGYG